MPLAAECGQDLLLLDVPGWFSVRCGRGFFRRYREDLVGFVLAWAVVGFLVLTAWKLDADREIGREICERFVHIGDLLALAGPALWGRIPQKYRNVSRCRRATALPPLFRSGERPELHGGLLGQVDRIDGVLVELRLGADPRALAAGTGS